MSSQDLLWRYEAVTSGPPFNFAPYVRFKAYSDLIIDGNVDFAHFRSDFED